jgi:hypothetical protein
MATTTTKQPTTRSQARKVYMYVVNNWAVYATDVAEGLNMPAKQVNQLLRQLERRGLLASTHVNSERTLTWQSYYDIENEDENDVRADARTAFDNAWPKGEKATTRPGGGGARYTPEQLKKAKAAKAKGGTRKQVAAAAGIASPNYLAKLLRRMEQDAAASRAKQNGNRSAKAARKASRKPRAKAAA